MGSLRFYVIGLIGLVFASLTITFGMGISDFTGGFVGIPGALESVYYMPVILLFASLTVIILYLRNRRKNM